ncbi:MAG: 4Fe-4S binding protein [Bacteroidota bacterium]|nr:4Fe-4S binding protein [Bacteroidota bacterium]
MRKRQKVRKGLLTTAFIVFPAFFYYLSPYLIIDGTMKGIISGSFIFFVLLFASSLILARAYCGWVCPAGGVQDIIMQVNDRKISGGNIIKWIIWILWIATIIALAVKKGGYEKIDPFYQTEFGLSMSNIYSLITYFLVLLIIVLPAFIFGRRSFCHSICCMVSFMILGRKLSNLLKLPYLRLDIFKLLNGLKGLYRENLQGSEPCNYTELQRLSVKKEKFTGIN